MFNRKTDESIFGNEKFFVMTGADSLAYLSVEGLQRAVQFNMKTKHRKESGHCTACLTGSSTN